MPQKPFLFSGTIASNVRFGNQDATDTEVWEALDVAQARDFVEAKPEKLGSSITRPSICSTTRSPPSTWPPTPACAPRSSRSRVMRSR